MSNERRYTSAAGVSVRQDSQGESVLFGTAIRFGVKSRLLPPGFKEIILPSALKRTLSDGSEKLAYFQHDPQKIISRQANGSLRLKTSAIGLEFESRVPNTQWGRDLLQLVREGLCDCCSFGFSVPRGGDSWDEEHDEDEGRSISIRKVSDLDLAEVSFLTANTAAYESTTLMARSLWPEGCPASLTNAFEKKLSVRAVSLYQRQIAKRALIEATLGLHPTPSNPIDREIDELVKKALLRHHGVE